MAQIIKFRNSIGSVEFSNKKPFLLTAIDGFSAVSSVAVTTKGLKQDGESFNYSNFEKRQLVINFSIMANTNEELMKLRNSIINIFNPKIESILYYSYNGLEKQIYCIPEATPTMSLVGNRLYSKGDITLIAYNPFFQDVFEEGNIISTWIGGWRFKFTLPFRFKQKGESKKNIYNDGHIETPVQIIFKGPALNPCVKNHETGEFIKIERELTSDDTLYITTEYRNKKVEIERNGVRKNAFNYIDLDSTFFQLQVGDNMIEYTTDNELDPQSVEIRYRNRYLGV